MKLHVTYLWEENGRKYVSYRTVCGRDAGGETPAGRQSNTAIVSLDLVNGALQMPVHAPQWERRLVERAQSGKHGDSWCQQCARYLPPEIRRPCNRST